MLLPFSRTSWAVGVLNSAVFNSFRNRVEFGTILEGLQNFGGGCWTPQTPPRYATAPSKRTVVLKNNNNNKYKCYKSNTTIFYYSTNCYVRRTHTREPSHHNATGTFVVAILLQKLRFTLKIPNVSVVIRRRGTVKIRHTGTTQYGAYRKDKLW